MTACFTYRNEFAAMITLHPATAGDQRDADIIMIRT
jgi:hypothetical protein